MEHQPTDSTREDLGPREDADGLGGMVSVIIPTYFRNDSLEAAIQSVLDQSYEHIEIIVVDDSGENHAEMTAAKHDVTYVAHPENRGSNPARNTGIEHSRGEYIQLLDDDDQLDESKIEKQVRRLERSDEVGVVYCGLRIADTGDVFLPNPKVDGDILTYALQFNLLPCVTSTMLTHRSVLEQIYPLANRKGADDVGMRIELARLTSFSYINEPLVLSGNATGSRGHSVAAKREYLRIIDDYDHLYESQPPDVRQTAYCHAYQGIGTALLEERLWSYDAIVAYLKACYHTPRLDVRSVGLCLSSVFGRPGKSAVKFAWRALNPGNPRAAN